jgi:hypothetical protein
MPNFGHGDSHHHCRYCVGSSRYGMRVATVPVSSEHDRTFPGSMWSESNLTTPNINDVDEIRRRMAQIRRELHQDVKGVVANAELATDWKHYVRQYPWTALAVASGIGFLAVPRRRRSVSKTARKAAEAAIATMREDAEESKTPRGEAVRNRGTTRSIFGFIAPIVMRAAQGYAAQYVENLVAQYGGFAAAAGPPTGGPQSPPPYTGAVGPAVSDAGTRSKSHRSE